MSTKLKLLGVDVASIGDAHGQAEDAHCFSYVEETNGIYKKIVVSQDHKKLLGAVLVGDTQSYGSWLQLYLNQMELPQPAEQLLFPAGISSDAGNSAMGIEALPDSAQICSCNDVSKADIVNCIKQGTHELSVLKTECNAGTGCGGCSQLVGQLLDSELVKLGVEVNNNICQHFDYSRTELYDIIRVKKIKTFESLIRQHGRGIGCEICKPAVSSILSALWNDQILKKPQVSLQDTNDAFLANMQKDGTYSVVPNKYHRISTIFLHIG